MHHQVIYAAKKQVLSQFFTRDPWNILEIFLLFLFLVGIILTVTFIIATKDLDSDLDKKDYIQFDSWATVYTSLYDLEAFGRVYKIIYIISVWRW
jgi:hypothetical protein